MKTKVSPLWEKVALRLLAQAEEKSQGGIVVPTTKPAEVAEAEVLAVGAGWHLDGGGFESHAVKPGDRVLVSRSVGIRATVDGHEIVFVRESEILAVVST